MASTDSTQSDQETLVKAYSAHDVEEKWSHFWENHRFFEADIGSTKPSFSIVMPPPNVTGVLHMGHALVSTLQDTVVRWKRMCGYECLWVPGADHAGISTQTVVERHLIEKEGKRRTDYGREEFLKHVWEWKEKSEKRITAQIRKIGCSCDWTRHRFTMDNENNRSVRTVFKKLYDEGLIYLGDYMVNWDPVTQTALADDEVEYEDKQSHLWYFKYPFTDGSGFVEIATTRPETMLGDTAVAVSPKDPRFKNQIGKTILLPLVDREIPLIADDHVDPEFGTGMVKVTPAHDPNDYEIGMRHELPFINIMTPDGKINENGADFNGMPMQKARQAVVEAMRAKGFLSKIEPHLNRVGVSYRSKAIIEPYISKQWFIRMEGFAAKAREAITEGKTHLIPKHFEKTYFHWIDNLRDWCISRQLWWGHRIPIWYRKDDKSVMICYDGEGVPPEVKQDPSAWEQDPDVLDTWFSSALWPFSTMGWPEETPEFKRFYPNSLLITGHDILFFWVARMMMMGEYVTGELPFPNVFLHGLIYGKSYWREDADGGISYLSKEEKMRYDSGTPIPPDVKSRWEKMSKSKGNVIDPFDVIKEYGTDAMRMALCSTPCQLRQIDLDQRRFEEFRNFANKVWNGARFVLMNLEETNGAPELSSEALAQGIDSSLLNLEDRWILSALEQTVSQVNNHLDHYIIDQAALTAYEFFWNSFCAYYVEIVKPVLMGRYGDASLRENKQKILLVVLLQAIRLLHPFTPFITEELFSVLKSRFPNVEPTASCDPWSMETLETLKSDACCVANYPTASYQPHDHTETVKQFDLIQRLVYSIRKIRGEMKIPPSMKIDVYLIADANTPSLKDAENHQHIISALIPISKITIANDEPQTAFASTSLVDEIKIFIPLPDSLHQKELSRLQKEQLSLEKKISTLNSQLSNAHFIEKAPEDLILARKNQLSQAEKEIREINLKISELSPEGG